MVEDTSEEKYFRERYSQQIRELKGDAELEDERKKVKHQGMKTPGRRGEQIKHEEIDRETIRRHYNRDKK
jgi:hypothetical protein